MGLTRVVGEILLLAMLHKPGPALGVTLPGPYSVALAWDKSPSSNVTGYRVYYGGASGNYTNSIVLGNVTTNTVPGLSSGVSYFFAVAAVNAVGAQSPLSNEIRVVPGTPTVQIRMAPNRQAVVTVKGLIGSKYDILATQNFITWTVLGNATVSASGSIDFTDTNAPNFARRFYRTQLKP